MNDNWLAAVMFYFIVGCVWTCTASLIYTLRLVEEDSKPRYMIVVLFLLYSLFWVLPFLYHSVKWTKGFIHWLTYKDKL